MKLFNKTLLFGLLSYSLGWLVLVINGISIIETFGWSLCFAGVFSLGISVAIMINNQSKQK